MRGRPTDYEVVWEGPVAAVRLEPDVCSRYKSLTDGNDEISVKRRTHLKRYFLRFCGMVKHGLGDEKFKKEGNFPDGRGGDVERCS